MAKEKNGLDRLYHRIEAVIATAVVDAALGRGWLVTVYNGEDDAIVTSGKRDDILNAMSQTDEDELTFYSDTGGTLTKVGWLKLIYGNDQDVISDYSAAREGKGPVELLADEVAEKFGLL